MKAIIVFIFSVASVYPLEYDDGPTKSPLLRTRPGTTNKDEDPVGYPKYHFEYGVQDAETGDVKEQIEDRDGEVVKGAYTLIEPDGTFRKVEYQDDGESGFNAIVTRVGQAVHPPPNSNVAVPVAYPLRPIPEFPH